MSSLISDSVAGLGHSASGTVDTTPLTEQERQQVIRLLSDPFSFPAIFKGWLISFLESSDLTLPISSVVGLSGLVGIGGSGNTSFGNGLLPPGTILPWGSPRTPAGALLCDGVSYSRGAYANLFAEIGSTWGSVDANSFNVPDLRRRVPVGVGTSPAYAIGASDGIAVEASRSIDHYHLTGRENVSLSPGGTSYSIIGARVSYDIATTPGSGPKDHPAYAVVNYIIIF